MTPRHRSRLLVALAAVTAALVPVSVGAGGAGPEPDWFELNRWSAKHGLPENVVRTILQTRDGYLWIATHAGVARFDGMRFTLFDERKKDQLRDNEVQALAEGPDGSVWMGTYGGGLSRLKDGRFTTYTTANGLSNDFILSLTTDAAGGLWIGSEGGLTRFHQGKFRHYTVADGLVRNQVNALFRDRDDSIWIATRNGGLGRFLDGKLSVETVEGLGATVIVRAILRDRQGVLWLATYGGLFRLEGGKTRRFTAAADGLASDRLYVLTEDSDGNLWVGGDNGLNRHRDGKIHTIPQFTGKGVTAVTAGREGGVWVGHGPLSYLRQGQFVNYAKEQGLIHHYVSTFLEDQQGSVWVGTLKGLGRWRDGQIQDVTGQGLPPAMLVGALAQDGQGHLWVGTDAGLYRSAAPLSAGAAPLPRFERVPGQPEPPVQARVMYVDRAGTLWIGSSMEGLFRYRDGAFTAYTTKDGLRHNAVRGIVEDRQGNLWMGTREGLNRFKDGKFQGYGTADGLAHRTVEALYLDGDEALWVATRQGLNRFKDGKFTVARASDGLLCNYVNGLTEDDHGNLWMTCIRGVFRAKKRELDALVEGRRRSVTTTVYGVEHGLISARSAAGFDRGAYRTRDGRVWFATFHGVSVVDPSRLFSNREPPPVHVQEVRIDQNASGAGQPIEAPPGRGDIAIDYAGLSFLAPEKVRFRYRLDGYDRDWVEADNRRTAYYNNIPPGSYTFRVVAANNDGIWNDAGASVALALRPHWYQTTLFRGSAVLGLLLLVAGLYTNHVRRLKQRQRELERHVDERTAELASANKELEAFSYSVSHDLRQPLRSITGFARALDRGHVSTLNAEGQEFLVHIRRAGERMERLIVDMLALARVGRGEIRRANVDLTALAREITEDLRVRQPERKVEVVVASAMTVVADPGLARIVLENLLGNAWKFTSKLPAARIEVGLTARDGSSAYFVRDDGAGFDPTYGKKLFTAFQRLHAVTEFEGSGVGLATVGRIVRRHGGEVWAEGAPDKGATFYFTFPG